MMTKYIALTEICNPKQWKTISVKNLTGSGFPVYGANGQIGYYTTYTHEQPTLMITCRGATCGRLNVSVPFSYINGNAMSLDNLSADFDLKFLYYYLLQYNFDSIISGSAQPQIVRENLKKIKVAVIPLSDQRKIAAILDKADSLRQKDKQLLKLYDDLAQSVFYEMFGDPVKNAKGWKIEKVETLVNNERPLTYGILMPGANIKPSGVPYVRVIDIKNNKVLINQLNHTTKEIASQYKRSRLREGDILMSIRGHVGRCCIVPPTLEGANITQDTARLDLNGSVNRHFALSYLNTPEFQHMIKPLIRGAAVKGLNLGDLKKLPIPVPDGNLQKQFEARITSIMSQKEMSLVSFEKSEMLFQSLLQKAFKGKLIN